MGGRGWRLVNSVVANFAAENFAEAAKKGVGNFADNPRNPTNVVAVGICGLNGA